MTQIPGMLSVEELTQEAKSGTIDTVIVAFTDPYGRSMGKRYDAGFFLEAAVEGGAHVCDYLFTVDVGMEPIPGYRFANWDAGYGDVHLLPDLSTLRRTSWLERSAMVQCDVAAREGFAGDGSGLLSIAPRSILRTQLEDAKSRGFGAMAGSELEFYSFQDSYAEAAQKGYAAMAPAGWYIEDYHILQGTREEPLIGALRRHLRDSGVPVENSKGEWGLGQHELNVRYSDALTMADRHGVYKQCVKEVADAAGHSVTFMAKPFADQAGSSCHIHMSLWSKGANVFPGDHALGQVRCSEIFRWFLGGWIAHAPEMMVFYAPNVNSYKRFRSGSWAPTRLAWSHDNRTAGFRVVGSGQSLRIECRIPGADCNPYLAFAASLASGLDGIARQIEPPAAFEGNLYAADELPEVPGSLAEATDTFAASDFAKQAFGAEVVEHYQHFFRNEKRAYDHAVTDWERARYFEQI
jgi:glutamine synthetase